MRRLTLFLALVAAVLFHVAPASAAPAPLEHASAPKAKASKPRPKKVKAPKARKHDSGEASKKHHPARKSSTPARTAARNRPTKR
jgi:hypothetical protein